VFVTPCENLKRHSPLKQDSWFPAKTTIRTNRGQQAPIERSCSTHPAACHGSTKNQFQIDTPANT
jgi:hypothetical protein